MADPSPGEPAGKPEAERPEATRAAAEKPTRQAAGKPARKPTSKISKVARMTPLYLLLLLGVAGLLYLYYNGHLKGIGLSPAGAVRTVPPGGWYQVYFTSPGTRSGAQERGGIDALVAADIAAATKSVDIASFEFDLESIAEALLAAHARGVEVRMVLDDGNLDDEEMLELTRKLTQAGIGIAWDKREPFMHSKFIIIDQKITWMGSWNLTINDTYYNNNNVIRYVLPEMAANYTTEFEEMYVDGRFGPQSIANTPYPLLDLSDGTEIATYFSPDDNPRAAVLKQLRAAQREIVFMAFSFTDDDMARILLEQARAGVEVRGVFESRNESEFSEYSVLKKAGLDVRLDGNPRTMHHKVFVIDGRVTITGSYNFSANAAKDNDENLVIITNPQIAASYREEFERVFNLGE